MAQFLNWDNSEIEQFSNWVIFKFIIGVPTNLPTGQAGREMRNENFIFRQIYLLTIYDKADLETIDDKTLRKIIKNIKDKQ